MTTLTGPVDPAIQAEADALPCNFHFPELLLEAWDNIRFRRRIPLEDISSPSRVDKRPRKTASDDMTDVEDSSDGLGFVSAQAPSDESLSLPTTVAAACVHLTRQEVRLARGVASASGINVLEDSKGLRSAISAVLAMLRDRGGAERVLLIVPEKDVVNWKSAAMQAQDEVNVTCFVKAAGATKNCLMNLSKCRKPGIVIAAREYVQKKTRDPLKAPQRKLYDALQAGGSSRWEMVLFQCADSDLVPTCVALTLLEQRRLDTLLLFGEESSSKLTKDHVLGILSSRFPGNDEKAIELKLPDMHEHCPKVDAVKLAEPEKCKKRRDERIALQPIQGNIAPRPKEVPQRSLSESPALRKGSSSSDGLLSDSCRRRSLSTSGLQPPEREAKRTVSRRGRISREHVQASLQESLSNMSPSCHTSIFSPHVMMKRKTVRRRPPDYNVFRESSETDEKQASAKSQVRNDTVSIDSICEDLVEKQRKKSEPDVIEIDSDFDPDCFVVSQTISSPPRFPIKLERKPRAPPSLKVSNGQRSTKSPTKRRSPPKTRSATLRKLIANSAADACATAESFGRNSSLGFDPAGKSATSPAKSSTKSPLAKALEEAVAQKQASLDSDALSSTVRKRTATLPRFAKGGPTYETPERRRSVSVNDRTKDYMQSRITSPGKASCPPSVKYASRGLLPPGVRKRYNSALRKAKAAEKSGDEEEALKWFVLCNEISDYDDTLMARILCFGSFALVECADEDRKRSLKRTSPKRSGGSSSRQESASVVRSRSRRNGGSATRTAPCEVIVIDD